MRKEDYYLEDGTHWRLYRPSSATKDWAVLWLQGFTSTIEGHDSGCERMSTENNMCYAILNYAGHGDHPVKLNDSTRKQQLSEVINVYDNLVSVGFKNIVVVGGSFGGYMAALLSSTRSPIAVILRVPANYSDDELHLPYSEASRHSLHRQELAVDFTNLATKSLNKYRGPVYIIEHEKDEIINPSIIKNYLANTKKGSYLLIPGARHSAKLNDNPKPYYEITEIWLSAIIKTTIIEINERII